MDTSTAPSDRGYRFPREIIAHCVWLYDRFNLSFRDIQERMLERGIVVSHETIRLELTTGQRTPTNRRGNGECAASNR